MAVNKYTVMYHEDVIKYNIPLLPKSIKNRIKVAIEGKLFTNPETFGAPLRRSLKGYRKLRVGDYRIIFSINSKQVKIVIIQKRSDVYTNADNRVS